MNAKKCKGLRKFVRNWNEVEYNPITFHTGMMGAVPLQIINPITRTGSCGRSTYQQFKSKVGAK